MNNDTQPLVEDQKTIKATNVGWYEEEAKRRAEEDQAQKILWEQLKALKLQPQEHVHGPFTFLLNQNHNALRGCQSCGQTWVGVMAGTEDDIRWHEVQEPPEEEEE